MEFTLDDVLIAALSMCLGIAAQAMILAALAGAL